MSIKSRARSGDSAALEAMFRQFLPAEEQIDDAAFLGLKGILGLGTHSFGAVTDRRVASLQLSMFGAARYRDGYHEHINSSEVFQPSRAYQIVAIGLGALVWLALLVLLLTSGLPIVTVVGTVALLVGLGVLMAPLVAAVFYRFVKSGLVLVVREGVHVYCFTDRRRLGVANELASRAAELRDVRLVGVRGVRGDAARSARRAAPGASTVAGAPGAGRTRAGYRTPMESVRAADPTTVLAWASAAVVVGSLVRFVGLTQAYEEGATIWSSDLRLVWVVPVAVCAAAALVALIGGWSHPRIAATSAVVGAATVVGLQVILDVGSALTEGADDLGAGFALVQVGGVVILVAATVVGTAMVRAHVVVAGQPGPGRATRERLTPLVLVAGALTALGAVMPWLAASGSGPERSWGGSGQTNDLYGLFLICSIAACLAVPAVVAVIQPRRASAGLLFGWSAALLGWAVGYELEGEFLFGFRLFETGIVASLALATMLLAGWRLEAAIETADEPAPWPPPRGVPSPTGSPGPSAGARPASAGVAPSSSSSRTPS